MTCSGEELVECRLKERLTPGLEAHPLHPSVLTLGYGTGGFRTSAHVMDGLVYRTGLVAALRSLHQSCKVIGMMITASHNPECDNGVKVIDPEGEMLAPEWERVADDLVTKGDAAVEFLGQVIREMKISIDKKGGRVYLGYDTRMSSPLLANTAQEAIEALGVTCVQFPVVTTPQLHFLVQQQNLLSSTHLPLTLDAYYSRISGAFLRLSAIWPASTGVPKLHVDCANGVGAPRLRRFRDECAGRLELELYNTGEGEDARRLNLQCGADYVKVKTTFPEFTGGRTVRAAERWASIDGDADRVVYFYADEEGAFHLLDGDKFATLVAGYLMECLRQSPNQAGTELSLGLVQTAYANAASTVYIREQLGVPVACVPTGVKYLHHRAKEFDIGIYFEANGHGTVLFSERARTYFGSLPSGSPLCEMLLLVNETVGDAYSDILLVEHILAVRGWTLAHWDRQYTDLPSLQLKVQVENRRVVTTTDAERRVVTPQGLQERIDALVRDSGTSARAFVRPSGTEDVVRVYAEAETREKTALLGSQVANVLHEMAGGVGQPPSL